MKILTIALLLAFPFSLFAQSSVAGYYRNYFSGDLQLHVDASFEYSWFNDFYGRWAKGKWMLKEDTLCFHIIPMYDTLGITKNNGTTADSLILSKYSTPRRVSAGQLEEVTVGSVEQNGIWLPGKVLFKENRLYEIKNGKLVTEKQKGPRGREYAPWYFKIE